MSRVPGSDRFSATFNSISYQMPKAFRQGDHDIARDPDLAFLRDDLSRLQSSTGSLPASAEGLTPILEKMESLRTYERPDQGLGAHERASLEQLRGRLETVAREDASTQGS